jgi:hypothetical protein
MARKWTLWPIESDVEGKTRERMRFTLSGWSSLSSLQLAASSKQLFLVIPLYN